MSGRRSSFVRGRDPSLPPSALLAADSAREQASADASAVFRFDDFVLDTAAGELRRAGQPLPIGPQALALLEQLVRHAGQALPHDVLQARIWPDVTVHEGSLRQAIWEVRQALSDSAGSPRYVRTLRGRGYRFDVAVTCHEPSAQLAAALTPVAASGMVGREAELGRVLAALDGALLQSGRVVVLRGAPGIGKSRLAREVAHVAAARGVTCLESHAERDAGMPPFWPWIQLLNGFLAQLSREQLGHYLAEAPLISAMLAHAPDSSRVQVPFTEGPDLQRLYLFEELTRLLTVIGRDRQLLLLLDDIQWLDEASTAFLRYFIGVLPRTRVLLVLTCRDVGRRENRPLAQALETVARGPLNEIVEVALLSLDEITRLLTAHCGPDVSHEVVVQVHALTLGNPLFAIEVARLLGRHEGMRGATLLDEDHREVRGVIQKRLASLPQHCLDAAFAASVWGDECALAELAALLDEPPGQTLERVDECTRHGIFVERGPLRFGFSHPLVGEVAYATLSRVERTRLHHRAATWLERKADSQITHLTGLAHHFVCAATAGVAQKAVDYAARCAERAFAATAYEMALRWYEQALGASELVAEFPERRRLDLELARGDALRASRADPTTTDRLFLSLSERAKLLGDPRLIARAALGYNAQRFVGHMVTSFALLQDPVGIELLEDASARVDPAELDLRARLTCALAFALIYGPQRARREALAGESVALARQVGVPTLLAHVLSFVQWSCAAPDAYLTQRAAADELIELTRVHSLREMELSARLQRIVLAIGSGDLVRAEGDATRAGALAQMLDSQRARVASQLLSLMKAFWRGDIDAAEQLTERIFEAQPSHVQHQSVYMTRKSALVLLRGGKAQLPQIIAQLQSVLALVPNAATTRSSLASAYAAAGQHEPARAHFDELAANDFAALPEEASWLGEMIALADCAVRLGDRHRAQLVYARLAPFGERMAFIYCDSLPAGPVARALAELATVLGDFDAAEQHLATSRELNRRLGAHMFLLYDALAEARLLMASRAPGWRTLATTLLDEVLRFASEARTRWLADDADELQQTLPAELPTRVRHGA